MSSNGDRRRFAASETEIEDLTVVDAEIVPSYEQPESVKALDELDLILTSANEPGNEVAVINDPYADDPFPLLTMLVIEESWPDPDKMAEALAICERTDARLGAKMHREIPFDWPKIDWTVPVCQECGLDHRRGFMHLVPLVRQG